jgi:hypothetical protein
VFIFAIGKDGDELVLVDEAHEAGRVSDVASAAYAAMADHHDRELCSAAAIVRSLLNKETILAVDRDRSETSNQGRGTFETLKPTPGTVSRTNKAWLARDNDFP